MVESTSEGLAQNRMVRADLVNLEIYATHKAITELFGERGWEVTWRWGEIAFEELRRQLEITEREPLALVQRLSRWFVEMGYATALEATQPGEQEIIYETESPLPRPAINRLRAENAVQPHYSAALIMAALKQMCGIEARMENVRSEVLSPTRSRQRWRLAPSGQVSAPESHAVAAQGTAPPRSYREFVAKRDIVGRLVEVSYLARDGRNMALEKLYTRAVLANEIHELITTGESAGPGETVRDVAYIGFLEVAQGGCLHVGDILRIDGRPSGRLIGFDLTHFPNHLNLVVGCERRVSGRDLGLTLEAEISFTAE